ncbi:MAG TPA: 1,6-anhydro-N-acetylmuramyl-L-alanine amidase AmpD [Usitatibacter sp.]|nr:1,6-anhydro-N-acetylmuramyl-L-alanine amidase AmpD [Usitatibacter sp.]
MSEEAVPSPHFDERPPGTKISLLVIHNISLPPGEYGGPWIEDLFMGRLDPEAHPYFRQIEGLRVSSHYLIRRDGKVIEYVPPEKRAWHAGESSWKGRERCNDFSIGIELEGSDDVPFSEPQYEALIGLARRLVERFGKLDLAGHSDVSPGRKTDPGPWFEWERLRAALA